MIRTRLVYPLVVAATMGCSRAKDAEPSEAVNQYQVLIPDEHYVLAEFERDQLPAIATVNSALVDFEPKTVFDWHLSIIIDYAHLADQGMPTREENEVVNAFEDQLAALIKADKTKPNALFLARITWNKTRQLLWRVNSPKDADRVLKQLIESKQSPRAFDYHMVHDEKWELARPSLSLLEK